MAIESSYQRTPLSSRTSSSRWATPRKLRATERRAGTGTSAWALRAQAASTFSTLCRPGSALGYSHPIVFDIPQGIDIAVDKQTHVTVTGIDRQLVGQVAADIRRMRKPDPYKQKGVRYAGEKLKKKAGKAGAGAKA